MAKTLTEMAANVGNMIQDTSTAMSTLIKGWINDGYRDTWRRCVWSESINDDYSFSCVAAQQNYNLPLDFDTEIFVADTTDGFYLNRYNEGNWWRERAGAYSGGSITSGTAIRYVILMEKWNSTHTGFGVIKLDPTPSNTHTIVMPYKRKARKLIAVTETCTTDTENKVISSGGTFITDGVQVGDIINNTSDSTYGRVTSVDSETQLTADWDICPDGNEAITIYTYPEILDIETAIECYATSQAEAYKRQYQKSQFWGNRYEQELARRIGQNRAKMNQQYKWIPASAREWNTAPFTGWTSYDSL